MLWDQQRKLFPHLKFRWIVAIFLQKNMNFFLVIIEKSRPNSIVSIKTGNPRSPVVPLPFLHLPFLHLPCYHLPTNFTFNNLGVSRLGMA